MDAAAILDRLSNLGVSATLDGKTLVLTPGNKVPGDLVSEVKAQKSAIVDRLQYCRACVCDAHCGGGPPCPACNGRGCRDCGLCLRASQIWREYERYAKYMDSTQDALLKRLQDGSRWLQEELLCGRDDADLYFYLLYTWAEIEEVLRATHGLTGCIFGPGQSCPKDASAAPGPTSSTPRASQTSGSNGWSEHSAPARSGNRACESGPVDGPSAALWQYNNLDVLTHR